MRLGFFITLLSLVLGCGDDGSTGSGEGSGTSDDTGTGSSADDGSGESAVEESGDDGPGGLCCAESCPDGAGPGDPCSGFEVPPPCCTATQTLLCANASCGSQSCAGTWEAASCDTCEVLQPVYTARLGDALACDPTNDQCVTSSSLTDVCGCEVAVNGAADLSEVEAAYQDWVDQGCGPVGCGAPCPVGEPTCVEIDVNGETLAFCQLSGG